MASKKADWHYHRNGCVTCKRAQEFLSEHEVKIAETVDARKVRLGPDEALAIARASSKLYVSKGKRSVAVDLKKDAPEDAALLRLIMGPSGNLRAPTIRKGTITLIGFDPAAYASVFAK